MTFRETYVACPNCGVLLRYHALASWSSHSSGLRTVIHAFWTDIRLSQSGTALALCPSCSHYFRRNDAREYDSSDVKESQRATSPNLITTLTAEQLYEAVSQRAYRGPAEECELRARAWSSANDELRKRVMSLRADERQYHYDSSSGLPIDYPDRVLACKSFINWWLEAAAGQWSIKLLELSINDPVAFIAASPDFENRIAEQVGKRQQALKRLWKRYDADSLTEVSWKISNLERLLSLIPEVQATGDREQDFNIETRRSLTTLSKAEVFRQLGHFDNSMRILGDPERFRIAYGEYRHVANVIHQLAESGYRFLWQSIGEEDYSPFELAERIREEVKHRDEMVRQSQLLREARKRDRDFVKSAMIYQAGLDKSGCLKGKTTDQLVQEKWSCPNCQFRYLWDGKRCGHCDKSVFEDGLPLDRELSDIRSELVTAGLIDE